MRDVSKLKQESKSKYAFYQQVVGKNTGQYIVMIRVSNMFIGYVSRLRSGHWQANTDKLNLYSGYQTRVAAAEALNRHRIGEKAQTDQTFAEIVKEVESEPLFHTERRIALFQYGFFTLASGKKTRFKIECDALTDDDWQTIALALVDLLPIFGKVEGVPTGGLKLAKALSAYKNKRSKRVLIADDVWTTGGSLIRYIGDRDLTEEFIGAVVFARGPVPRWVIPLMTVNLPN